MIYLAFVVMLIGAFVSTGTTRHHWRLHIVNILGIVLMLIGMALAVNQVWVDALQIQVPTYQPVDNREVTF